MDSRVVAVSYSVAEGSDAGVGIAIWSSRLSKPQAGRIDIPSDIRKRWSAQRAFTADEYFDIQEVEGIGPLLVLTT